MNTTTGRLASCNPVSHVRFSLHIFMDLVYQNIQGFPKHPVKLGVVQEQFIVGMYASVSISVGRTIDYCRKRPSGSGGECKRGY